MWAGAQEADEAAETALEVRDYEPELIAAEADEADDAAQGVWWGNRSHSYGNYLRFERIDTGCPGKCVYCDENKICCETGCVCEECQYICDDCDNCPPMIFDKIFFDLDKDVLRPEGIEECEKVIRYMNAFPEIDVLIEGHCCDLASEPYNIDLGRRRAESVERYLVDREIDPGRISTQTFGETSPWVGVPQRELNRRAVVIVIR